MTTNSNMKTFKMLFIIPFFAFFFQSCERKSPCTLYTSKNFKYSISENTKNQIPYSGNETLQFISNTGDTANLVGNGKRNYFSQSSKNVNGNPECPRDCKVICVNRILESTSFFKYN